MPSEWSLPSALPIKNQYTFHISPMHTISPLHVILLDLLTPIISDKKSKAVTHYATFSASCYFALLRSTYVTTTSTYYVRSGFISTPLNDYSHHAIQHRRQTTILYTAVFISVCLYKASVPNSVIIV
jgi:hypothetical protein